MQGEAETFVILPGEISDTSFIPMTVENECIDGYRWLSRQQEETSEFELFESIIQYIPL